MQPAQTILSMYAKYSLYQTKNIKTTRPKTPKMQVQGRSVYIQNYKSMINTYTYN